MEIVIHVELNPKQVIFLKFFVRQYVFIPLIITFAFYTLLPMFK
jgi:hypothetical protein